MPVQQVGQNSPLSFYRDLPPVTRALFTAFGGLKLLTAVGFGIIQYWFYLSWSDVVQHWQVWRLVTPFMILSGKGFEALILLIWTLQYGKVLETSVFANQTADFVWMLLIICGSMLVLSLLPFLYLPFLANSLVEGLMYVWSRHFPTTQVSLFGLVPVQAFYLPFAYIGLSLVMGGSLRSGVLGILAGHLYYYLATIYPAQSGRRVINTPRWLPRLLLKCGVGRITPRETGSSNPSAAGFRAFRGQGIRLG